MIYGSRSPVLWGTPDFAKGLPVHGFWPTGSKYICDPPVTNTDEDWVCWTNYTDKNIRKVLKRTGWKCDMGEDEEFDYKVPDELSRYPFLSFRKGDINLIVFFDPEGLGWFVEATEIAKRLNVTDKEDRIALFNAVQGGRYSAY